jgi:hypothetical protein
MGDGSLRIYMNDQHALGIAWRELAKRAGRNNAGTELGEALATVADGIAEDVATFEIMMDRLGLSPSPVKPGLAMVGERLARLKLNGRLTGYSPLSRFLELDMLVIGIEGKKLLWTILADGAGLRARLPDIDFDELVRRADAQVQRLSPFRHDAAEGAFAPTRLEDAPGL